MAPARGLIPVGYVDPFWKLGLKQSSFHHVSRVQVAASFNRVVVRTFIRPAPAFVTPCDCP
jgi:hypothetical protein